MKKTLILEFETISDIGTMSDIVEHLQSTSELQIIEDAMNVEPQEILAALSKADELYFETTWMYGDKIHAMGKLLANVDALKIFCVEFEYDILSELQKIFSVEELATLSKHEMYGLPDGVYSLTEEDFSPPNKIDLEQFKVKFAEEENIRITRNHSFKSTGRKVKIGQIQSNNPEFANLKLGDFVDELDCREIDERHGWGIWVMGVNEPVKLLNSNGYQEFEFVDLSCCALAREFMSRRSGEVQPFEIEILAYRINKFNPMKLEITLWEECDEICQMVKVERRGNRHYFNTRLEAYYKKFHFFKEVDTLKWDISKSIKEMSDYFSSKIAETQKEQLI